MNDKAFVYIIWFAISVPLSQITCRWLWGAVCESVGKSVGDVKAYRAELSGSDIAFKMLHSWLLSVSPNPSKTRKMIVVYQLCTMLPAFFLMFSVIGLFTNIFDKFLDIAAYAIIALMMLYLVAGFVYHKYSK